MKKNSILIISNEDAAAKQITEKIKLLRECDVVKTVNYIGAISVLNSQRPSIIIIYCSNSDSLNIIKEVRAIKSLDAVPVIFVMNSFIEDYLLHAFDNGIDDFFFLTDTDSIILIRIFLTLQKAVLYKQLETCDEILECANIKDKQTGLFSEEQAPVILRNLFLKNAQENAENTVFMCIKPLAADNKRLNICKTAAVIQSVPRADDIKAFGKDGMFYLLLYNSGAAGADSVFSRIKHSLNCEIYAAAAEASASFDETENLLLESLKEQTEKGEEFNFLYDFSVKKTAKTAQIKNDEKTENNNEQNELYKDFQKDFFPELEKITAPVFYQIQSTAANIYPDAKIDFDISENQSIFTITQDEISSGLIITYSASSKLILDIKHKEQNEKSAQRRLTYNFQDFTAEILTSVLKDLIREFSDKLNLNTHFTPE